MSEGIRIEQIASFVCESASPAVSMWAVCYALDLGPSHEVNMTTKACQLNISPQGLSKQVRRFSDMVGAPESSHMYKKGKS